MYVTELDTDLLEPEFSLYEDYYMKSYLCIYM